MLAAPDFEQLGRMSSSTKDAVLAIVANEPNHGYGVFQRLRRYAVDPEAVASSSVYAALSRLEEESLIEVQAPDLGARRSGRERLRLTYVATTAGQQRAAGWVRTLPASYDELRVRIALARPADLEVVIGFVRTAEEANLRELTAYDAPLFEDLEANLSPWGAICGSILGSLGAADLMGRAQWLKTARMALESLRDHPERDSS